MKNSCENIEELKQENIRLKVRLDHYSTYEHLLEEEINKNQELICKIRDLEMQIDNLRTRIHY